MWAPCPVWVLQASARSCEERAGAGYSPGHIATLSRPTRAGGGGVPGAQGPGHLPRQGLEPPSGAATLLGLQSIHSLSNSSPITGTFGYPGLQQPVGRAFLQESGVCGYARGPWASRATTRSGGGVQISSRPHSIRCEAWDLLCPLWVPASSEVGRR